MQTGLATREQGQDYDAIAKGILEKRYREAREYFASIRTFEDLKVRLLMGEGHSRHTYRSYTTAAKQFWQFMNGRILLATIADIEHWYDHLITRCSRETAAHRVMALKKVYTAIEKRIPFYESPFTEVPEKLKKKLSLVHRRSRKEALYPHEVRETLAWLSKDHTERGRRDHSLFYFMVTSGFRAEETVNLGWGSIEHHEDKDRYFARGRGKGDKDYLQPVYGDAVETCREYFRSAFGRGPQNDDWLFWSIPSNARRNRARLTPNGVWRIVRGIGEGAKTNGVITRQVDFYPHLLRKTYATLLYEQGMGLADVKALTRHSHLQTLERHYIVTRQTPDAYLDKALGRNGGVRQRQPGGDQNERTE